MGHGNHGERWPGVCTMSCEFSEKGRSHRTGFLGKGRFVPRFEDGKNVRDWGSEGKYFEQGQGLRSGGQEKNVRRHGASSVRALIGVGFLLRLPLPTPVCCSISLLQDSACLGSLSLLDAPAPRSIFPSMAAPQGSLYFFSDCALHLKCVPGYGSFSFTAPTKMLSPQSNAGQESLGGGLTDAQERASAGVWLCCTVCLLSALCSIRCWR